MNVSYYYENNMHNECRTFSVFLNDLNPSDYKYLRYCEQRNYTGKKR